MSDDRRKRMGGSDFSAIVGLNPWKTATGVFLEKTGRAPKRAEGEPSKWGTRLEQLILDRYGEDSGVQFVSNRLPDGSQEIIQHPKHKWIAGAPDAWSGDRVIDAKSTGGRNFRKRWGRAGTDDMPEEHAVQVTIYCELRQVNRADVPVLVDGRDFKIFSMDYDPEFAGNVIQIGERFWVDNVLADKPPTPESTEERYEMVRGMYPENRAPIKISDHRVDLLAASLKKAREDLAANEVVVETVKSLLQEAIGDAEGVGGEWGRILFRKASDSTSVNWEQVARDAAVHGHLQIDTFASLIRDHSTTRPGSRRFLPQFKKEK